MAHLPSRWDQIVRTHLDGPIDDIFGEAVIVVPMRSTPNGRHSQDPDRVVVRCTGVFTRRPNRPGIEHGNRSIGGRGGNQLRSIVEGTLPKLNVPDSAFPPGAPPRQGDMVEVREERFQIVSAKHDSVSRFILDLVAPGSSAP